MPVDIEISLDKIREEVKNVSETVGFDLLDTKVEEIAFGLKALYALVAIEESGGQMEKVEKSISDIGDVGSVEVVRVTRL
ncbi:MAG: elongation factor 1-beta [Nitrososphaeria archaeon]|nr:elongation factor 1-beta [Nitrososphaeria archaeon]NIN53297.1 elongation factor 1-beta [Nitrososphaeria archaeon]NIQ33750.1 elongation factor 1-beta [Nitrososphaeria archaeon]